MLGTAHDSGLAFDMITDKGSSGETSADAACKMSFFDPGSGRDLDIPTRVLKDKMLGALAWDCWDENAQRTVGNLVERNIRSVHITVTDEEDLLESATVNAALAKMLCRFESFNTNEPILIIALYDTTANLDTDVDGLAYMVLSRLWQHHNIKPVRVALMHDKKNIAHTAGQGRRAYSFTLLNVVNTDIGGPSMVQLFDNDYTQQEWRDCVEHVEAWHDRTCLWLHRVDGSSPDDSRSLKSVADSSYSSEEQVSDNIGKIRANDSSPNAAPQRKDGADDGDMLESSADDVPQPEELPARNNNTIVASSEDLGRSMQHPSFVEIQIKEHHRSHVVHPTWQHLDNSGNLIDMVSHQASKMPSSDKEKGSVATECLESESGQGKSEEAFEIV